MTRRQDSQQHKMNKLQSSSGLGEFPYAAAFRREPARALGRRHPEASCASRGEDSVVGNYLTSSAPPSASSSSSQW